MNVEGAELFVLEDLVEAGLTDAIDGYYGPGTIPRRLATRTGAGANAMLKRTGVRNFRFNHPDCNYESRKVLVRYDMLTSILASVRRRQIGKASRREAP